MNRPTSWVEMWYPVILGKEERRGRELWAISKDCPSVNFEINVVLKLIASPQGGREVKTLRVVRQNGAQLAWRKPRKAHWTIERGRQASLPRVWLGCFIRDRFSAVPIERLHENQGLCSHCQAMALREALPPQRDSLERRLGCRPLQSSTS